MAVYEISGSTATLTRNSTSANGITLWTVGWVKAALTSPVAAQGVDREVMLAHSVSITQTATTGMSPVLLLNSYRNSNIFNTRATDGAALGLAYYFGNQTTWPSSIPLTNNSNSDYFYPFMGVY
jgi:hypothetical protein